MRPELGVVQIFDGILHVVVADEFDDARAVLEHVRIAYIARLAHMILQVLPGAGGRQARDYAAVVGATGGRPGSAAAPATASGRARAPGPARALLQLDAQLVAFEVVAVAAVYGVLGVQRLLELDEGEGRSLAILQVNVLDLAVLVEEVLEVFGARVLRQVADIDAAIRFGGAHRFFFFVLFFFCIKYKILLFFSLVGFLFSDCVTTYFCFVFFFVLI